MFVTRKLGCGMQLALHPFSAVVIWLSLRFCSPLRFCLWVSLGLCCLFWYLCFILQLRFCLFWYLCFSRSLRLCFSLHLWPCCCFGRCYLWPSLFVLGGIWWFFFPSRLFCWILQTTNSKSPKCFDSKRYVDKHMCLVLLGLLQHLRSTILGFNRSVLVWRWFCEYQLYVTCIERTLDTISCNIQHVKHTKCRQAFSQLMRSKQKEPYTLQQETTVSYNHLYDIRPDLPNVFLIYFYLGSWTTQPKHIEAQLLQILEELNWHNRFTQIGISILA